MLVESWALSPCDTNMTKHSHPAALPVEVLRRCWVTTVGSGEKVLATIRRLGWMTAQHENS